MATTAPAPEIPAAFETAFETLNVDGKALKLLQVTNMPAHIDRLLGQNAVKNPLTDLPLWAKVWPAALVLGRFLRNYDIARKTMLELGAGTGACSLVASNYGFSSITVTDVNEDALQFARANIAANGLEERLTVRKLDVTQPGLSLPQKYDFICASELLYLENLHRPLLNFIGRNLAQGGRAFFCVDLCRQNRHFEKMAAKDFTLQSGCVGLKSNGGEEKRAIYKILILEAK